VQEHLTDNYPSSQKAMIFSPLGKFWRVELGRHQSGMLLGDGWAQFLMAHDLSEGNILVFRYEDNMVFTVEAFMQNGCLKEYEAPTADMTDDAVGPSAVPQQGEPARCTSPEWLQLCAGVKELVVSPVKKKRKTRNENTCLDVYRKKSNLPPISSKKVASQKKLVSTVPRHSFTKRITSYDLASLFVSTTVPLFI